MLIGISQLYRSIFALNIVLRWLKKFWLLFVILLFWNEFNLIFSFIPGWYKVSGILGNVAYMFQKFVFQIPILSDIVHFAEKLFQKVLIFLANTISNQEN